MERFRITSTSLQCPSQDLNFSYGLYVSLHGYVQTIKSSFTQIEQKAKTRLVVTHTMEKHIDSTYRADLMTMLLVTAVLIHK